MVRDARKFLSCALTMGWDVIPACDRLTSFLAQGGRSDRDCESIEQPEWSVALPPPNG